MANQQETDYFTAFNKYRTVWLYALFDLPVTTKTQMKAATQFRKGLLQDGFVMFQFSVYIRHCASKEQAEVHVKRVKMMTPSEGMVTVLQVTDKQFGEMITLYGAKRQPPPRVPVQLELF